MYRYCTAFVLLIISPCLLPAQAVKPKTENVIWVMLDGLRWQELFQGAEERLMDKEKGGVSQAAKLRQQFWRDSVKERREVLLPFFWGKLAKEGQIFGNPLIGTPGQVTNGRNFSYPGYNEVLCGFPDSAVDSNDKKYNKNVTVLEWLHEKPEFSGKIAAFTSWDVFPYIINDRRSKIPVNSGLVSLTGVKESEETRLLNHLIHETPLTGEDTRPDALTYHAAKIYLKEKQPRILFISFDETDAQGHAGRYDRLLGSARKNDGFIKDLWETVQGMSAYRDKTTLIVTTDHGRGDWPVDWKSHGAKVKGSHTWWAAVLGPDTPALGERQNAGTVGQNQVAATAAAALGFDYPAANPRAAKALPGAIQIGALKAAK